MEHNHPDGRSQAQAKLGPSLLILTRGRSKLLVLIVAALILGRTPYLNSFLSWQTTFFHEISHGLAALLSGGRVLKIELHFSGSGVCWTSGGVGWLISLAGYAGAAFWGLLIYLSAGALPARRSHLAAVFLVAVLAASAVFYARDFQSWLIISVIAVLYAAAVKLRDQLPLELFLELSGLYIILDALKAPAALLQSQAASDAARLAAQTGLPELFWISLWTAAAVGALAFIWKVEGRPSPSRSLGSL